MRIRIFHLIALMLYCIPHFSQKEHIIRSKKSYENKTNFNCGLECDTIVWMNWSPSMNKQWIANYQNNIVVLNPDQNIGTILPMYSSITLSNLNTFFPKNIGNIPTLWMPGITGITKLKHRILVDSIKNLKELVLLVGDFPNQKKYNDVKQTGFLKVYDRNNNPLDISKLCLLFNDNRQDNGSTKVLNSGKLIEFNVDDSNNADGGVTAFTDFPMNSSIIEIEHNNDRSDPSDGIFIHVGFPKCCVNDTIQIDSTACNFIVFDGNRIDQSGIYQKLEKNGDCATLTILRLEIQKSIPFTIGQDTSFCAPFILKLQAPSGFKKYRWNTGDVMESISVSSFGKYWCCANNNCGVEECDTINIKNENSFSILVSKDTTVTQGSFIQLNSTIIGNPGANYKYEWTPKSGLSCTDCPNPIAVIRSTTKYKLKVIDLNSSCESTAFVNVHATCCIDK